MIESAKNVEKTCKNAKTTIFTKENGEKLKTQVISSFSSFYSKLDKGIKDIVEKESPKQNDSVSPKQVNRYVLITLIQRKWTSMEFSVMGLELYNR